MSAFAGRDRPPHEFLVETARRHGDLVDLSLPFQPIYLLSHPDYAEHVLQTGAHRYKKGPVLQRLGALLGRGLLTSNGSFWLRQRRLSQPAFHHSRQGAMARAIRTSIDELIVRWSAAADRGETVDLVADMFRVALDITCNLVFGPMDSDEHRRLTQAVMCLDGVSTPESAVGESRPASALSDLNERVQALIDRSVSKPEGDPANMLSMLATSRVRDTGERMTAAELRDEVVTLLFAGHETTACLLAWTWVLVWQHPDVETRVRREVVVEMSESRPDLDHVRRLHALSAVIAEVLRLFPPVWNLSRTAIENDIVDGYPIDEGSLVLISPYVVHRHPDFWTEPDAFLPDRFAPGTARRHRFAYIPFGGGPRTCIGDALGLIEAQMVLASLIARFELRPTSSDPVCPVVTPTTLRPPSQLMAVVTRVNHT